jgi:benzoyl-CoA-dihydrodiol lyase
MQYVAYRGGPCPPPRVPVPWGVMMAEAVAQHDGAPSETVSFETHPDRYRHWKLSVAGPVATLRMDTAEDGGLRPGYKLKLNSYDLGVDIELHDALQRIRFEHPGVRTVVLTSAKERVFCSGANIFMLGLSSHPWKVNFCKFTNETRNGMEDSSAHSGLKFLAACNGTTAGGGYELALACDEIVLVDDRSSAVSLPEVPLLGVLPGTGGLTRLTDKRRVRRDHADLFCTTVEGVRGARAKAWRLVDEVVKPHAFDDYVARRAGELAALSDRPAGARGVLLPPLALRSDPAGFRYEHVDVRLDAASRRATITVSAPASRPATELAAIEAEGAAWWPLAMARELDDAILRLRSNHLEYGLWLLRTRGQAGHVLACDGAMDQHRGHWFVRECIGMLRRTLARLDVSARSLFALIEPGSCFAGTLLELALAADRSYMLQADAGAEAASIALSPLNFGEFPTVARTARLSARFYGDEAALAACRAAAGRPVPAAEALALGLVTSTPDVLDWDDEVRLAIEERASLSPDALSGMEASLRFGPGETMESRIFGRLSAWQNWIFIRPNAVGESGALKVFGTGRKARFNWERV